MLSAITLHEVLGRDARLREALRAADLPIDDIKDEGCADDYLLRSVVVLPAHRGYGFGRAVVEATLLGVGGDVFLATTSAAPFFSSIGFSAVPRAEVPVPVLATRQLSSICPSSATIMKLNRPPT